MEIILLLLLLNIRVEENKQMTLHEAKSPSGGEDKKIR